MREKERGMVDRQGRALTFEEGVVEAPVAGAEHVPQFRRLVPLTDLQDTDVRRRQTQFHRLPVTQSHGSQPRVILLYINSGEKLLAANPHKRCQACASVLNCRQSKAPATKH